MRVYPTQRTTRPAETETPATPALIATPARPWLMVAVIVAMGSCRSSEAGLSANTDSKVATAHVASRDKAPVLDERQFAATIQAAAALNGAAAEEGAELIGTRPPDWSVGDWIGSPPLTLAALRGKVVLIRWFTDGECPYCAATAPALNQLHHEFATRGLMVIGIYHHKRSEPLDMQAVRGWVHDYGFEFPVAVDRDWRTLNRWWLNHQRNFTSVSFLLDSEGFIRRIHPGGTLALGSTAYAAMHSRIEQLLRK